MTVERRPTLFSYSPKPIVLLWKSFTVVKLVCFSFYYLSLFIGAILLLCLERQEEGNERSVDWTWVNLGLVSTCWRELNDMKGCWACLLLVVGLLSSDLLLLAVALCVAALTSCLSLFCRCLFAHGSFLLLAGSGGFSFQIYEHYCSREDHEMQFVLTTVDPGCKKISHYPAALPSLNVPIHLNTHLLKGGIWHWVHDIELLNS